MHAKTLLRALRYTARSNHSLHALRAVSAPEKTITLDNVNPHVKSMVFPVRGPVTIRAEEIEKELEQGVKKSFNEVIRAHIGDSQAMGQPPITFIRQVLALCCYPELLKNSSFPEDAKERARRVLSSCSGKSVGSYSACAGLEAVREDVANYIERRDGLPANYSDIIIFGGASEGVGSVMKLLKRSSGGKAAGILVPVPLSPLYSAAIAQYGMFPVPYFLDEDNNWALSVEELSQAIDQSRKLCNSRGIVVINPGNPTGQVLTPENIRGIIEFALREELFIFADEVYQHNVYSTECTFHSFKKVMMEMGGAYKYMELASFMSVSQGYAREGGLRGGYAEVINLDPEVREVLHKSLTSTRIPSPLGQAALEALVNPPQPHEPSYEKFNEEKNAVLGEMKIKAELVQNGLNRVEGLRCNGIQGAMYAFPNITLPERAIIAAKNEGVEADMFYVMRLLEQTGICVVPGSGFGQKPGTYHFRTTILPSIDRLETMLQQLEKFHLRFTLEFK